MQTFHKSPFDTDSRPGTPQAANEQTKQTNEEKNLRAHTHELNEANCLICFMLVHARAHVHRVND